MMCRMMASAHELIEGTLKNNCITPEVADFHSRVIKGAGIDDFSAFPDGQSLIPKHYSQFEDSNSLIETCVISHTLHTLQCTPDP